MSKYREMPNPSSTNKLHQRTPNWVSHHKLRIFYFRKFPFHSNKSYWNLTYLTFSNKTPLKPLHLHVFFFKFMISPTYLWKIPGTLQQQFLFGNFFAGWKGKSGVSSQGMWAGVCHVFFLFEPQIIIITPISLDIINTYVGKFHMSNEKRAPGWFGYMRIILPSYIVIIINLGTTPHPVTVTTRIITFLIGNPYKPSFVTVTGWGVDLK